jgi:methionyl-tRNA formyltransferase
MTMRLVFAGTPAFAAVALAALLASRYPLMLVLTQPDRPARRGLRPQASEVKALAQKHGIEVFQPASLKSEDALSRLKSAHADAMVVAAYGLILPKAVLDLFPFGCVNIHASLLPRWRGAAPIQRALLAGDPESGACIMRMDAGLDTGPLYICERVPIEPSETGGSLHDKLAAVGARLVVEALDGIEDGRLQPRPQPFEGATYAAKVDKKEAILDWKRDAVSIERTVRAFNPVPGALSTLDGEPVKIWRAQCAAETGAETGTDPGQVISADEQGIVVACGKGALRIIELQRAGGKRLAARDFVRGRALAAATRFGV